MNWAFAVSCVNVSAARIDASAGRQVAMTISFRRTGDSRVAHQYPGVSSKSVLPLNAAATPTAPQRTPTINDPMVNGAEIAYHLRRRDARPDEIKSQSEA